MALTRRGLKAMGIDEEKIDEIIAMHTETVNALNEQISTYKADAEKLPDVQKELDALKKAGDDGYKEKYEKEHQAFEDYKNEQTAKETRAAKETAYKALLTSINLDSKYHSRAMKGVDFDSMELTKDGKFKDAEKIGEAVKEEWADAITTETTKGAQTANPPSNTGAGTMTKEDIMKIKDPVARQTAIAENLELFQKKG